MGSLVTTWPCLGTGTWHLPIPRSHHPGKLQDQPLSHYLAISVGNAASLLLFAQKDDTPVYTRLSRQQLCQAGTARSKSSQCRSLVQDNLATKKPSDNFKSQEKLG